MTVSIPNRDALGSQAALVIYSEQSTSLSASLCNYFICSLSIQRWQHTVINIYKDGNQIKQQAHLPPLRSSCHPERNGMNY